MPPSKMTPEDSFQFFHTTETITSVAHRLGVTRVTLTRWWIAEFGRGAWEKRVARKKMSPEEKRERRKSYRERNKESIQEVKKRYAAEHSDRFKALKKSYREQHREEVNAYNRAYYTANAVKLRGYARRYRKQHLQEVRAKERAYYKKHPEILLLKNARKRAKDQVIPFAITVEDIRLCIPENNRCPLTQEPFERGIGKVGPRSMTLDRIIPELGYVRGNIAVISHLANTIKQNCTDPAIFRRMAAYIESGLRCL